MPRYAISDIHGCLKTFKKLLDQIDFSKTDELFLLGDYIDRGPDSKGLIDHIWWLQKEGYQVHCLKGNHEQMMLDARSSARDTKFWLVNGGEQTMDSFGAYTLDNIPKEYFHWMETLPHYLETEGYILVHAGLNFDTPDPMTDQRAMLWIRNWYHHIDQQWLDGRVIIHGHTPTMRTAIFKRAENLNLSPALVIDNGCFYDRPGMHSLMAYNLDQKALRICPYVD